MLNDFPWYARYVQGTPCKHVGVCTEKVDEHCFLFGVEARANPQRLTLWVIEVERNELGLLCRLEAAGVTLRVEDLLGKSF